MNPETVQSLKSISDMREMRNAPRSYVGNLKGRDHSEDLRVDGTILEWKVKVSKTVPVLN
jgi:hypothetical protein